MSFFHTTKEEIERLNPLKLTNVLKKLLRANLSELRLKQSDLTVSLDINDPDGGLDGFITTIIPNDHPWLPGGQSGWQFKAVRDLYVSDIINDVLTGNNELKPEIRRILDSGGTYVLVNGSKDYNSQEKRSRKDGLNSIFEEKGFPNSKIIIYSSGDISDWINSYPAVISFLKPERMNFKDIIEWKNSTRLIQHPLQFVCDENRNNIIETIRLTIESNFNNKRATIIRIVGLSGVGKSRLIYEILNINELKDVTLYLESPEKLPHSKLNYFTHLPEVFVIIVIDECPNEDYIVLSKEIEGLGGRLVFISLDYDIDNPRDPNDLHYVLPPLDDASMGELIEATTPTLPKEAKDTIIKFAEGYPRIASLLAENFIHHPDLLSPGVLTQIGILPLLDRLIAGRTDSQTEINKMKLIMTGISLFKRLGWDDEVSNQGRIVCEHFGINWNEARQIVENQCRRGLVVKRGRYRYISPIPVAIYLSSDWWRGIDETTWREFFDSLPDYQCKVAFLERVTDLSYSERTKDVIKKNLEMFNFQFLNNEFNSALFLKLSQADHTTAMTVLEDIFKNITTDELLGFKEGRRNIIWVLEKIKWWPDTFDRAAQILLQLAIAENETWSNNATGVFSDLFKVYLGGSAVPIWERLSILEQLIDSDDEKIQLLALQALSKSFILDHSSRTVGAERQGTIIVPQEWNPMSREDIIRAINSSFLLLDKALKKPNPIVRNEAASILFDSFRRLLKCGFYAELKQRMIYIGNNIPEVEGRLVQEIETTIHYDSDKMPSDLKEKLVKFRNSLVHDDYHSQMKRYIKNRFFIDELNREEINQIINYLAKQSFENPKLFEKEFSWLFNPNVANGYLFGQNFSKYDEKLKWLPVVLNEIKQLNQPSVEFLGGYLSSIREKNELEVENTFYEFQKNLKLRKFLPELIWRSGFLKRSVEFLIEFVNTGEMQPSDLIRYNYGAWFTRAEENDIKGFLECLKMKKEYYSRAIEIIYMYSRKQESFLKKNISLILIFMLDDAVFDEITQLTYYEWDDLANKLIEIDIDLLTSLLNFLIEIQEKDRRMDDSLKSLINISLEEDPEILWSLIKDPLLEGTYKSIKLIFLFRDTNFIDKIPSKLIKEWLNENPDAAPSVLAQLLPLHKTEPELHPLAKFLLIEYPDNKNIGSLISSNWHTEVWSGDESRHVSKKLEIIEKWINDPELSDNNWLIQEKKYLEERLQNAKLREEEEGF